ncbi:vitamin D3 receptor B-like [Babylonia areolata]|uniref:vitamin D3 receptor B-like n=1 Tax=Babylonia areolata TaxID=304850 RepID=UPI003FD6526F
MAQPEVLVASTSEDAEAEHVSSVGSPQPSIRKKQRMNGQKTCRVCGDRALAHNFDVVSCESCKAFFRRNALKTKIKPCAFSGDCEITPETRRFCAHCRLQKCLQSGMKADMILDEAEKKARQDKLTENRRKREAQSQSQDQQHQHQTTSSNQEELTAHLSTQNTPRSRSGSESCSSSSSSTSATATSTSTTAPDVWVFPPPTTFTQVNRSLRGSAVRNEFLERAKRQATLLDFSILLPQEVPVTAGQQEIDTSFQHVPHDQLPSDPHQYWRLGNEERALLTDLTIAYQQTVLKLPQVHADGVSAVNVQSILSRCQRFATDIVNFVKRVPDFRALHMADQVAALKGASWRTFLVKCSANFVVERNSWIKDNGYLSVEQFTEASPEHRDRILLLARYSAALKHIIRNDPTTFAVLQVLVLFDPRDPNLSDRQLVSAMADKYSLLLKHLLQSQWSYDYAGYYLNAVRDKVQQMSWVADSIQVMFIDWLHLLEPLMREVLNLT